MELRCSTLTGVWLLVSGEVRYENGAIVYPWGPDAEGSIMYSEDGYMSAIIMDIHRPRFVVNDILAGTIEEQAMAARTYVSYGGTYEVFDNRVVHHVKASLFPNWIGMNQVRFIDELSAERLVLRTPPMPAGGQQGVGYLIWKRR